MDWKLIVFVVFATFVMSCGAMPDYPTVLAWDANPPQDNVVYYNIYGVYGGGTFAYLGSTTDTIYSDYEELPGDFYYVVTAVDDQNRESGPSNEVMVTVPQKNDRLK